MYEYTAAEFPTFFDSRHSQTFSKNPETSNSSGIYRVFIFIFYNFGLVNYNHYNQTYDVQRRN